MLIVAGAAPFATFGGSAGGGASGGGAAATVVVVSVVVVCVGSVVVCVGSVVVVDGSGGGGATGEGEGTGGANNCSSWKTRFASAWLVSLASGWNAAGERVPMSPTPVTTRISGSAQELSRCADAKALPTGSSASAAAMTPTRTPTSR